MSSVPLSVIKHNVGLLYWATELGNVSRACKVMGFARDTLYHYQSAVRPAVLLLGSAKSAPHLP